MASWLVVRGGRHYEAEVALGIRSAWGLVCDVLLNDLPMIVAMAKLPIAISAVNIVAHEPGLGRSPLWGRIRPWQPKCLGTGPRGPPGRHALVALRARRPSEISAVASRRMSRPV
jgi:hypothetical protein